MDLAYRAGAPLRNMEFIAETPLGVVGTNIVIPQAILSDGATLHTPTGAELETNNHAPLSSVPKCMRLEQQYSMHEISARILNGGPFCLTTSNKEQVLI